MAKLLKIEEEKYRKIESSAQNNLLLNKDRSVLLEGGVKKLQTEAYIASTTVYVRKKYISSNSRPKIQNRAHSWGSGLRVDQKSSARDNSWSLLVSK